MGEGAATGKGSETGRGKVPEAAAVLRSLRRRARPESLRNPLRHLLYFLIRAKNFDPCLVRILKDISLSEFAEPPKQHCAKRLTYGPRGSPHYSLL